MKKAWLLSALATSCIFGNDVFSAKVINVVTRYNNSFDHAKLASDGTINVSVSGERAANAFSLTKTAMERICISEGGNSYMAIQDKFGDNVEVAGFVQSKLKSLSVQERENFAKYDADKKFLANNDVLKALYNPERYESGFVVDTNKFNIPFTMYNTECRDINTNKTIYKTRGVSAIEFEVYNDNTIKSTLSTAPVEQMKLENYFGQDVDAIKGDRILLKRYGKKDYFNAAQAYCNEGNGKLFVNGIEVRSAKVIHNEGQSSIGCTGIKTPFVIESKDRDGYLLTKNKNPEMMLIDSSTQLPGQSQPNDIYTQSAVMTSYLPVGADSENNIGNEKLVSTVYVDNGSYKLVNVRQIGAGRGFKNFRVSGGNAQNITASGVSFNTLQIPDAVKGATKPLSKQCVLYGAAGANIEGYTLSCTRQSFGSNCAANIMIIKGDQFISKESLTCQ